MPVKGISVTPDIAWNNISILKIIFHKFQWIQVILSSILCIHDQLHFILINQIFVFFFHKTYYYIDFPNSNFMKLLYNTFNEWFSINFKKTFGHLSINWNHTHSKSCCQDNGSFGCFLLKFSKCFSCWPDIIIQIVHLNQFFQWPVDHA